MKLLTICTAVYNAEKYLTQMIESLCQSEYFAEIELILVNDGSTDSSLEIIKEYQSKFPESIFIIDKENGGSGAARNEAFKVATGKYIKLIDADDWIDTEQFNHYINGLKKASADLVINPFYRFDERTKKIEEVQFKSLSNIHGEIEVDKLFIKEQLAMHGVTYRTEIIRDNDIRLSEGVSYVDVEYLTLLAPYINSIRFINYGFYIYRTGIAGQSVDPEVNFRKHDQKEYIFNHVENELKEKKLSTGQKRIVINALRTICISMIIDNFFPKQMKYKNKIKDTDNMIKEKDEDVYNAMSNDYVIWMLRRTDYLAYYPLHIGRSLKHLYERP